MTRSYSHSTTFGSLKGIKEKIEVNLTSFQYLATLDFFLKRAVDILHKTARPFVENYAAKVVAAQILKPATKFSMNDKSVLPCHLFNLLLTKDIEHLDKMRFNRGVTFGLLSLFLTIVNRFVRIHSLETPATPRQELVLRHNLQDALGMGYEYNLYAISEEVKYWEEKAQSFKALILQKYVRMSLMQAQSTYKELAHSYPLSDITQIYLIYAAKAIDRCDSRQGVLTTFIGSWLKSAKAEAAKHAKESYHQSYEALVEEGVTLGEVLPASDYEALEHLAAVAKQYDPEGVLRATLRIPEFITAKQLAVLKKFVIKEKSHEA